MVWDQPSLALKAAYGLFWLFALSWTIAAIWTARTSQRPPAGSQTLYGIVTVVGFAMLFTGHGRTAWRSPVPLQWAFFSASASGHVFCWWARIHLGALWSGSVTRKEDHRIVDTGPYGLVRHPIYTGLIVSGLALGLLKADIISIAGAVILTLGWWIKARLEESFLRAELGPETYDAYAARVPMLIPFAPK